MSVAVDFAWSKPSVAELKSWGAVACGMYVSHDSSKNASAALVSQYAAAGIKSFLFAEDTARESAGGYAAGQRFADFALPLAESYGMPSWAPVIAVADWDVPDYAPNSSDPKLKLGPVGEYLRAWRDHVGLERAAVYGSYYVCMRAVAAGLARFAVQTVAWSGGQVDLKDIALYQNGQMLDGGNVDVEVIVSSSLLNLIAWVPGEPDPEAPASKPPPKVRAVSWQQWPAVSVLKYGDANDSVAVLQTALRNSGIRGVRGITVDRRFGSQTLTATRNFQLVKGLAVDGIAGPRTRAALVSLRDV